MPNRDRTADAGGRNAIIQAVSNGVVVVFAAGNSERDIDVVAEYRAVYPEVIAVAATDQRDRRAGVSNFAALGARLSMPAPAGLHPKANRPASRRAGHGTVADLISWFGRATGCR